jgi:hypothetical protein
MANGPYLAWHAKISISASVTSDSRQIASRYRALNGIGSVSSPHTEYLPYGATPSGVTTAMGVGLEAGNHGTNDRFCSSLCFIDRRPICATIQPNRQFRMVQVPTVEVQVRAWVVRTFQRRMAQGSAAEMRLLPGSATGGRSARVCGTQYEATGPIF